MCTLLPFVLLHRCERQMLTATAATHPHQRTWKLDFDQLKEAVKSNECVEWWWNVHATGWTNTLNPGLHYSDSNFYCLSIYVMGKVIKHIDLTATISASLRCFSSTICMCVLCVYMVCMTAFLISRAKLFYRYNLPNNNVNRTYFRTKS